MFGIFKKTNWKIDRKALDFFRQVFTQLPAEFQFLSDGLDKGLYRSFSVNHAMSGHFYTIGFDPSQSDKSMTKGKQFELENIIIKQDGQVFTLNITIFDGLWVGFEIGKSILDFNNFQVDLSSFKKSKSKFVADTKIEKLVKGLTCKQLDLTNLGEFEADGKLFYQIKDLQDGNYIAIDNKGKVYGLIQDPYKIELINKSVRQFVDDVNSEKFDFDKYLNGENGNV
ncbi:hypothetical protein VB776_12775 [Arcicella sp. DC2W]|uniref:Uncharacterized protein n=1 Tax=Arcicella gelida TaxID=2984195 RepID=A0ABU5S5P4_9BACT|nr:hypothetical protein [Arcicella sp. DC2W]MEA5403793.1 hypothetical protein [Arcicella sp. DC2W]